MNTLKSQEFWFDKNNLIFPNIIPNAIKNIYTSPNTNNKNFKNYMNTTKSQSIFTTP